MKINLEKWDADRLDVESKIKALKHSIRHEAKFVQEWKLDPETKRWRYFDTQTKCWGGSADEYQRLTQLKFRATMLYKVRAQYRGRQHQLKTVSYADAFKHEEAITPDQERAEVEGWMSDYGMPDVETIAA